MKPIARIKIDKLETKLNKFIRKDVVSAGFDVCMHSTGVAIIRTTDTTLFLDRVDKLSVPKKVDLLEGVDLFLQQAKNLAGEISQQYKIDINNIEDCFFGSNVKTLKALARFSILTYSVFRGISGVTKLILPTQARKKVGFVKSAKGVKGSRLKTEIRAYVNELLGTEIKDHDIADAVVLALCGVIE